MISFSATTQDVAKVRADLLAVPFFADRVPGPGGDIVEKAFGGGLKTFLEGAGFSGKPGETIVVPLNGKTAAKNAVLIGLGARDEVDAATLRRAGAALARRAAKASSIVTTVAGAADNGLTAEAAAGAFAEGVILGSYKFLEYKSEGEQTKLRKVSLASTGGAKVQAALKRAQVITEAVAWARDMVNEPAGAKSPTEFAAAARRLLTGKGVRVTILNEAQMRTQKMGGVLGVGQGSVRPPRFVKVVYEPTGKKARGTLALVGKGVIFDSGGLSIKPAQGMETMKTDMSGAAAVLATMATLRALGVKHRVVAYAPMVENMPSGNAIRPGDVLKMRNGKTVEVLNTDAEGRLILADALALAVTDGSDAMVDLATLTGACVVALGEKVAGLMGNDSGWVDQVRSASDRAGEPTWPLPLPDEYRKLLESEVADLRNIGTSGMGGALTAGIFLEAFVDEVPWAHLDIAGPARAGSDDGELTKGGTGFGVRTLVELVEHFDPPAPKPKKPKKSARKPPKKSARKPPKKSTKSTRTSRTSSTTA
ncbi:MAG: leucyl aminopeptidase [Actinobacteria bacterium]|nr:leucyl aminopeptidase [Actinomycetota bacterium]